MGVWRGVKRLIGMGEAMTQIAAGTKAPGFSLKDAEGKAYSLEALLQKGPLVAAFFKVSCPVCQFTFPFVERLHKRYAGEGVTVLGISQDGAEPTKDFAKSYRVTFPLALDEKGYPASNAYGLTMVPTIFLIESDGTVKVSSMGFVKKDLEVIARELAERRKMQAAPLFQMNESVPANKPG
jgi:peroxiredoxin